MGALESNTSHNRRAPFPQAGKSSQQAIVADSNEGFDNIGLSGIHISKQIENLNEWFDTHQSIEIVEDLGRRLPEFGLAYDKIPVHDLKESTHSLGSIFYPLRPGVIGSTLFDTIILIPGYYLYGLIHRQSNQYRLFKTKVSLEDQLKSQFRLLQAYTRTSTSTQLLPQSVDKKTTSRDILDVLSSVGDDLQSEEWRTQRAGVDITPVTPFLFVPTKELKINTNTMAKSGKSRKRLAVHLDVLSPSLTVNKESSPPHKKTRVSDETAAPSHRHTELNQIISIGTSSGAHGLFQNPSKDLGSDHAMSFEL